MSSKADDSSSGIPNPKVDSDLHSSAVNEPDSLSQTPLFLICRNGSKAGTELLLNAGADISKKSLGGQTPLHIAAAYNRIDVLRFLLNKKADTNVTDSNGNTALHFASRCGSLILLTALCEAGAKVDTRNSAGLSAMHICAQNGFDALIAYLKEKKASPNTQDKEGNTPMHIASMCGFPRCVRREIPAFCGDNDVEAYKKNRKAKIMCHCDSLLGGHEELSERESLADVVLRDAKRREYMLEDSFLPSLNFLETGPDVWKNRTLFKLLHRLPKGAALHIHIDAQLDATWFVKQTYDSDCYLCGDPSESSTVASNLKFHFFESDKDISNNTSPSCNHIDGWRSVVKLRSLAPDASAFDAMLGSHMSMKLPTGTRYDDVYPTVDAVWAKFQSIFGVLAGLFLYLPVHKRYVVESLDILRNESVYYVELRADLVSSYNMLYAKNQSTFSSRTTVSIWREAATERNMGLRFIQGFLRDQPPETIGPLVSRTRALRDSFDRNDNVIAALDFVGQEDTGRPLIDYIDILLNNSERENPMPYAFHAGETKWSGIASDENVVDALLLNSSRIGHGFDLARWPYMQDVVRSERVGIEVCPISNQILGLVSDLRDHPLVEYISRDLPVVVSSDDPGLWGASGLTYDWVAAFLVSSNSCTGIGFLKGLARNSLEINFMSSKERENAKKTWERKWGEWVDWVIEGNAAHV
eukprot:g4116.t1